MSGRLLLLVWRLAVKDLRHRRTQSLLLLLAIAASAAALTLGLSLHGTTDNPYARTRSATNGPDVVATTFTGGSNFAGPAQTVNLNDPAAPATGSAQSGPLLPFTHAAGVAASSGPFPITWTALHHGRTTGTAEVEGRTAASSAVDQPKLITGTWVHPGAVVVEAAFASAFDIHVGDQLILGSRSFAVAGTAVSAAIPAYPGVCNRPVGCFLVGGNGAYNPGLMWATQSDTLQFAGSDGPNAFTVNLKLDDPSDAIAFAARGNQSNAPTGATLYSWQSIRDGDAQVIAKVQQILVTGSSLLALLAVASVVILVGGRLAEQSRRVGLLKVVGATPLLVAAVLVLENVLVALCAAVGGSYGRALARRQLASLNAGPGDAPDAPFRAS